MGGFPNCPCQNLQRSHTHTHRCTKARQESCRGMGHPKDTESPMGGGDTHTHTHTHTLGIQSLQCHRTYIHTERKPQLRDLTPRDTEIHTRIHNRAHGGDPGSGRDPPPENRGHKDHARAETRTTRETETLDSATLAQGRPRPLRDPEPHGHPGGVSGIAEPPARPRAPRAALTGSGRSAAPLLSAPLTKAPAAARTSAAPAAAGAHGRAGPAPRPSRPARRRPSQWPRRAPPAKSRPGPGCARRRRRRRCREAWSSRAQRDAAPPPPACQPGPQACSPRLKSPLNPCWPGRRARRPPEGRELPQPAPTPRPEEGFHPSRPPSLSPHGWRNRRPQGLGQDPPGLTGLPTPSSPAPVSPTPSPLLPWKGPGPAPAACFSLTYRGLPRATPEG